MRDSFFPGEDSPENSIRNLRPHIFPDGSLHGKSGFQSRHDPGFDQVLPVKSDDAGDKSEKNENKEAGSEARIPFPIRVLQTKEGELYVLVDKAGVATGGRGSRMLWATMMGPLDTEKPLRAQLEGVGLWMKVEQAGDETRKVMDNWNSKTEGAFAASVDLSDLLNNEAQALAAIRSSDRKALEAVCPNPFGQIRTTADD